MFTSESFPTETFFIVLGKYLYFVHIIFIFICVAAGPPPLPPPPPIADCLVTSTEFSFSFKIIYLSFHIHIHISKQKFERLLMKNRKSTITWTKNIYCCSLFLKCLPVRLLQFASPTFDSLVCGLLWIFCYVFCYFLHQMRLLQINKKERPGFDPETCGAASRYLIRYATMPPL